MTKTIVKIEGMMCGMCESHVNDAVRKEFDVKKVTSSHSKGITEIISPEPLDNNRIKSVIEGTGYKFISAESEPYEKKGLFSR